MATAPAALRNARSFDDRADALGHFFVRAGDAPRFVAYDDELGCPLDNSLSVLESRSWVLSGVSLAISVRPLSLFGLPLAAFQPPVTRRTGTPAAARWALASATE